MFHRNDLKNARIAIFGAGAIGTWVGARLAAQRIGVTAIARGRRLEELRNAGWKCRESDGMLHEAPATAVSVEEVNTSFDIVFIAVKGSTLFDVHERIARLCTQDTIIIPLLNGVPWWFTPHLQLDREQESIRHLLPASQILGAVLYVTAYLDDSGTSQVASPGRILIGELDGDSTPRLQKILELLRSCGLPAFQSGNIRGEIWDKLTANLIFNPLSALTRSTTDRILAAPLLQPMITQLAMESSEIARALRLETKATRESVVAVTESLGPFKTSMLRDVERGRPMELETIVEFPRGIAKTLGIETPCLDQMAGLLSLLNLGLQDENALSPVRKQPQTNEKSTQS